MPPLLEKENQRAELKIDPFAIGKGIFLFLRRRLYIMNGKMLILQTVIRNYFAHDVCKNAAGLAYYLLFAIFPLLIFISNVLGLLHLDIDAISQTLQGLLPAEIVGLIESYLDHVSRSSSHFLLWFSLVFSVWFPFRAAKGLMADVRLAHGLPKPEKPLIYGIHQLMYTLVLLLVTVLTPVLLSAGEMALAMLSDLSPLFSSAWKYIRFILTAVLMYFALGSLYALSQDRRLPSKQSRPGILAALCAWLLVSVTFSFYAENFANYSLVYGALGAVMLLLIWLYLTAIILILGAELNAALNEEKGPLV